MNETNNCETCHEQYDYDTEASPSFCSIYCSRGCAEDGGWDFKTAEKKYPTTSQLEVTR
jgi:hypothetical protein